MRWIGLLLMALACKVGSFTITTGTGTQAVTGVGFQPKALMCWITKLAADGSAASAHFTYGFAVSGSSERSIGFESDDAAATSAVGISSDFTRIIRQEDESGSTTAENDRSFGINSFDADGFTISKDVDGDARLVVYVAFGGDDLTNAALVNFNSPGSTGNSGVTGVGFQPDCIILTSGEVGEMQHIGFCDGTNQAVSGWNSFNAQATSNTNRHQRTDRVHLNARSGAVFTAAEFVSFDADGFTLNWLNVNGTRPCIALCLKGGSYKVGSDSQKTSTGTKATTGVGFQPTGLMLLSFNNTATTSLLDHNRVSIGAASGSTQRACAWMGDRDNVGDTIADHDLDTAACLKMLTEAGGGSPTLEAEADLDSFGADGFTLDWVTADATAREFIYLAVGSAGSAELAGTSSFGFSNSGALDGDGGIDGSAALAFADSGVLNGAGDLSGTSNPAFTNSGIMDGAGALTGTSSPAFTVTSNIEGVGPLTGSISLAFTVVSSLDATGNLLGTSSPAFTLSSTLDGAGALAGSSALVFDPTATFVVTTVSGPVFWSQTDVYTPGFQQGDAYFPGAYETDIYHPGFQEAQGV